MRWAEQAPAPDRTLPIICVANHTNWWDGFIACLLTRRLGWDFRVLMEAQNLARYRIFLRIGALPLHRDSPRAAHADLERARGFVVPGTAMWVFPQGRRRPAAEPLQDCERGAAHLALGGPGAVRICPVAFRYAFLSEQLPEAFALVGESWTVLPGPRQLARTLTRTIETRLGATIAALDERLAGERVASFRPLVDGRLSVNKRMDRFRHAAGLLDGPFESRNG